MGPHYYYNNGFMPVSYGDSDQFDYDSQDDDDIPFVVDETDMMATQYMAQDELGQISFGYAHSGQAATNYRDALGNQFGNWAFTSPEGQEITVAYTAGSDGFRAFSDHLPVAPAVVIEAPTETAEVAAARAEHLALYVMAKNRQPGTVPNVPTPVTETPEVALARQEFMKVFNEVKARNAALHSLA